MIRRPPRSTLDRSSAASDVYKRQVFDSPSDKEGKFISYDKFHKLEKRGMHFQLFETIFQKFGVAENPLVCVTPVAVSYTHLTLPTSDLV